jgi:hypothetical protein
MWKSQVEFQASECARSIYHEDEGRKFSFYT